MLAPFTLFWNVGAQRSIAETHTTQKISEKRRTQLIQIIIVRSYTSKMESGERSQAKRLLLPFFSILLWIRVYTA